MALTMNQRILVWVARIGVPLLPVIVLATMVFPKIFIPFFGLITLAIMLKVIYDTIYVIITSDCRSTY